MTTSARRTATAVLDGQAGEVDADDPRRLNLQPGGKSLTGDSKHSPVLQVRVSRDLLALIRAAAARAGMSPSRYARRVLEQHFEADDERG